MKSIALHWWILIGLVFGALVGWLLAPKYTFNKTDLKEIKADNSIPDSIIIKFEPLVTSAVKNDNRQNLRTRVREALKIPTTKPDSFNYSDASRYFPYIDEKALKEPQGIVEKIFQVKNFKWLGEFFLNALKMIIVPLILCSIIAGVVSIGRGDNLGKVGLKTLGYYLSTSLFAIMIGLCLVNFIEPGAGTDKEIFMSTPEKVLSNDFEWYSIFLNLVHPNFFEALTQGKMLSIIAFALTLGIFILQLQENHKTTLKDFFEAAFAVMMKMTMLIIKLTPIGVFGIAVGVVADAVTAGTITEVIGRLLMYSLTVFSGLLIHALIVLPLLMWFLGKIKNPFQHLRNMATPLLNAFGTASSSATLPLTMEALKSKTGVSNRITSFTIPLGATVNMDGTALYECVAAIFIAQAYSQDLSLGDQLTIVLTALMASIGAAGIPGAGLVMMSVILTAVELPLEGVGLLLAVDRILDMCRTAVNVWSDSCGAVIIASTEGEQLNLVQYK